MAHGISVRLVPPEARTGQSIEQSSRNDPRHEPRRRSIAKALSWRILAMAVTVSVAWVVTGRADIAAGIGAADSLIKLAVYYGHERFWNRVGWLKRGLPPGGEKK